MYITNSKTEKAFLVEASYDKFNLVIDRYNEIAPSPVAYFSLGLISCVTMGVSGYFLRKYNEDNVKIDVKCVVDVDDVDISKWSIVIYINIHRNIEIEEDKLILEYINNVCTVSKLVNNNIKMEYIINSN